MSHVAKRGGNMLTKSVRASVLGIVWMLVPFASGDTFTQLVSPQAGHAPGGVAAYNGRLYVWSGDDSQWLGSHQLFEIYDPIQGLWTTGADYPPGRRAEPGAFVLNGRIYSVGGEGPTGGAFNGDVYRYDPATNTWTRLNDFPRPQRSMMFEVCNGKAYAFGGRPGYGPAYGDVYEYDEPNDAWIRKADMPTSTMDAFHVAFQNRIYVFGGDHRPHEWQVDWITTTQIYDPATDTWQYGASEMPAPLRWGQALVRGTSIWLLPFGRNTEDQQVVREPFVYEYSPLMNTWRQHALEIPARRIGAGCGIIGNTAYLPIICAESGPSVNEFYALNLSALPAAPGWERQNANWQNTQSYPEGAHSKSCITDLQERWTAPGRVVLTGGVIGDGALAIASIDGANLHVRKADGTMLWTTTSAYNIDQIVLDDADGDGRPDVFACGREAGNTYAIWAYRGFDGLLLKTISVDVVGDEAVALRGVCDLDGDGDMEIVALRNSGYGLLRRGLCVLDYDTGAEVWFYEFGPGTREDVVVADVNGDGQLELLMGSAAVHNGKCANGFCDSGSWLFCFGHDGTLLWATALGNWIVDVALADIDADDSDEIIAFEGGDYYSQQHFCAREIRGTDGAVLQTWCGPAGLGLGNRAVGDVRSEPGLEMITGGSHQGSASGQLFVIGADFVQLAARSLGTSWNQVWAIVDMDGDGAKEIFASSEAYGSELATLYALDGNLQTLWSRTCASNVTDTIVSDLDNNGQIELLVTAGSALHVYGPPSAYIPGDLNCDGVVNYGDINPFVQAFSNPPTYLEQHSTCCYWNGDCNHDGWVTYGDINCFVELLIQ